MAHEITKNAKETQAIIAADAARTRWTMVALVVCGVIVAGVLVMLP